MKKCSKCKKEKSESEFRFRSGTNNLFSWCKSCEYEAQKERYVSKPRKPKKPKCKVEVRRKAKERMLKHRYGITVDDYNKLYKEHGEKCGCCGTHKELGGVNGLYVDHCHDSGEIRGLLCPSCNTAIGLLGDNLEGVKLAVKYLSDKNS